jgi:hypothetical protein
VFQEQKLANARARHEQERTEKLRAEAKRLEDERKRREDEERRQVEEERKRAKLARMELKPTVNLNQGLEALDMIAEMGGAL